MGDMQCKRIEEVIQLIQFTGTPKNWKRYGSGHINDTFLLICEENSQEYKYILQRINHEIFTNPVSLMKNIAGVTSFLREQIKEQGGDTERETLNIVKTRDGKDFCQDKDGNYWRAYCYIEGATCFDLVRNPEDFYQSGKAFGHFQRQLSNYPAKELSETIVDFHNTPVRLAALKKAIGQDKCGRVHKVQAEIAFAMKRENEASMAIKMLQNGELPLRVTHNDTKLNNIMIDDKTGLAICIIDLDTIMPGLSIFDFGDSIRFGANTAEEDETDLSKVSLSLPLYEIYTKGFLEGCQGSLTEAELSMLPMGAKLMTYECGIRFLTDYLQGDIYFRITRENQNLDRTRTQFALIADMEHKWSEMAAIVQKYS